MTTVPEPAALSLSGQSVTAGFILRTIRSQFDPNKWIFVSELRTRTGYGDGLDSERFIDAFAMAVWPSDGFKRVAYEIKVSRADWLAELRQPEKHMAAFLLAHEFWIAVAPGVFQETDVYPHDSQGRMTLKGIRSTLLQGAGVQEVQPDGRIRTLHRAIPRTPWPMPESFMASLLRRLREQSVRQGHWEASPKRVPPGSFG